jgi:hypothetical protein
MMSTYDSMIQTFLFINFFDNSVMTYLEKFRF